MTRPITEPLWQQLTAELTCEMRAWRLLHPKATLRQIETALDTRLSRMRVRMREDLALSSPTAGWAEHPAPAPLCPDGQHPLDDRGTKTRTLQTHGGQELQLTRSYGVCPAGGAGLFPPR